MLPTLVALETFNLLDHVDRAQVVMFRECNDFEDIFEHMTGYQYAVGCAYPADGCASSSRWELEQQLHAVST